MSKQHSQYKLKPLNETPRSLQEHDQWVAELLAKYLADQTEVNRIALKEARSSLDSRSRAAMVLLMAKKDPEASKDIISLQTMPLLTSGE